MGGSLEDCFTMPGSYLPSWVLPDSAGFLGELLRAQITSIQIPVECFC